MKITLDKKILGGFIMCSLVLLVVAVISFRNSGAFITASGWVTHTHEVLYEFEQIMVNAIEAESAVRGFIITGKEDYLEPFEKSRVALDAHMDRVDSLTSDNPAQTKNVKILVVLTRNHRAHLDSCISLRRSSFEKANAEINTGESRRMLNAIRALVQKSRAMEEKLLYVRKSASERDAYNFNIIFMMLLGIIIVVLLIVYLIIMANLRALRRAERETAAKNWTLEGTAELVRAMQGNKTMPELSREIIGRLTKYLTLPVGALYLTGKDMRSLKLTASVALHKKEHEMPVLTFGEGLAGQAAQEKKIQFLENVHANDFAIGTTFGQVQPKHLLAVPLLLDNQVVGVAELGSLQPFTNEHKQYLKVVADSIAIAMMSCMAREEVRDLLEETQRQAEELEAQQYELRQANDELHAKTDMLEQSEQELKVQQEELQQTNVELEEKANMLEEQREKLTSAQAEIQHKVREVELSSRYKSEFLANMSHELRTPLNSILILAQLLADNKSSRLGEKEVDFARNIHTSGTGLLNLINEILDLSKIEAGKMQLDVEPVVVEDMVETVQAMFAGTASTREVNFNVLVAEDLKTTVMSTDRLRVEQIIRNLLSNAFKFTPRQGTVTLEVSKPTPSVAYRSSNLTSGDRVIAFCVSDTGIGIAEDKRNLIFQAFQQADGSTKRKYGGTGLGLSISRELSHALGGEIHLHSEVDKGSSFTLYLPLALDASLSVSVEKEIEIRERIPAPMVVKNETVQTPSLAHETLEAADDRHTIQEQDKVILILEDDLKFANILLDFVRDRSYKGVIASQGNTGLSLARHFRPLAILLDINLPVMDGNEVLRQLKNDPDLRHIPVQIISAYDKKREGLLLGAFDYIQKPVSVETLTQAFERIESFTSRKLKKLLIIEDNEQQNAAIRELIGNGDVKSYSAYRGLEAYEMLEREAFDCIIVDLGLPDISGFDLMEKIRANPRLNRVPIVVYTGRDLKKEETARLNKLADTVVLKTASSHERLLDETILFLHRVESNLPKDKQTIIRKLHRTDEVLRDKKILIVDDDIRNIYSLTNALEEEGLHCITAENGKVALQTLTDNPDVDMVLMDVMMPEMDGYEATQEIRKLDRFKKLPIIALTAKAMKGDKEKCLAVGMSDYVSKPVNVGQLLSLMRVWLYR